MKQNKYLITGDDIATMGLTLLPGKTELSGNKALTRKDILDNYLVEIAGITDDNRLVTYERVSSSVYLNLNKNTLNFTAAGGSDTITIDTNLNDSQISINTISGFTVSRTEKTITVTASNLGTTITNAKSVILTVSGEGLTSSCTLNQAGNYVTKINYLGGSLSYPTIGAGDTSATPTLKENGHSLVFTSGSIGDNIKPVSTFGTFVATAKYSLGSIINGFTAVNSGSGVLTATHRGSIIGNARTSGVVSRDVIMTYTPTAEYNAGGTITGTGTLTATCTQEANTKTQTGLLIEKDDVDNTWISPNEWDNAPAKLCYLPIQGYELFTFSSGDTSSEAINNAHDITDITTNISVDWAKAYNSYTRGHSISLESRGTTLGDARTGTVSWTYNGFTSNQLSFTQMANTVTWSTPTISHTTPVSIAATGGTDNIATGLTYSQTGTYTSGSTSTVTSGGTLSYTVQTAKTGFSLSGSTVTITNNTSTSARNGFVVRITLTLNGKTATKDITYNQSAGYYTYATPTINLSYSTIAASGGTATPTLSYSQTWGWNGATTGGGTITSGATVSYSGTSVNTTNGSVTASSKGTTVSGITTVTTATVKVTLNSKSNTAQYTVKQAANEITSTSYKNYNLQNVIIYCNGYDMLSILKVPSSNSSFWIKGTPVRDKTVVYTSKSTSTNTEEIPSTNTVYVTISIGGSPIPRLSLGQFEGTPSAFIAGTVAHIDNSNLGTTLFTAGNYDVKMSVSIEDYLTPTTTLYQVYCQENIRESYSNWTDVTISGKSIDYLSQSVTITGKAFGTCLYTSGSTRSENMPLLFKEPSESWIQITSQSPGDPGTVSSISSAIVRVSQNSGTATRMSNISVYPRLADGTQGGNFIGMATISQASKPLGQLILTYYNNTLYNQTLSFFHGSISSGNILTAPIMISNTNQVYYVDSSLLSTIINIWSGSYQTQNIIVAYTSQSSPYEANAQAIISPSEMATLQNGSNITKTMLS